MTIQRQSILALLTITIMSGSVACGGGSGGSIPLEDLSVEVASSICEEAAACGAFPSTQACIDSLDLDQGQLIADVTAGLTTYNGDKARECLNNLTLFTCTLGRGSSESPAACDETFTGSIAIGGDCFSDESCAGEADCDGASDDPCSPGTCVATVAPPTAGESCSNGFCGGDLYCNSDQVCTALVAAGGTCVGLADCVDRHICNRVNDQATGTCVALPDTGGSCDPEIGGSFLSACLKRSDFCDPADMTCKSRIAVGASCAGELLNACVQYAGCIDDSCVSELLLGESCVVDGPGPDCLGSLECVGGTCAHTPDMVCSL